MSAELPETRGAAADWALGDVEGMTHEDDVPRYHLPDSPPRWFVVAVGVVIVVLVCCGVGWLAGKLMGAL